MMGIGRAQKSQQGDIRGVFVFALLAAFAVLSLLVVVVGARAYRTINRTADAAYVSRTGMRYLMGKVRGSDEAGMLEIRSENGVDVLVLGGVYGGERYETYIYCEDGIVREYFAAAENPFDPGYGEEILQAQTLSFSLDGTVLTISLVDGDGGTHVSSLFLTAGGEAAS
jgi:hypothetical protein